MTLPPDWKEFKLVDIVPEGIMNKLIECHKRMYGKALTIDIIREFLSIIEPLKPDLKKQEILPEYLAYFLILKFEELISNEGVPNYLLN